MTSSTEMPYGDNLKDFFKPFLNWRTADLQCCVSFRCTAKCLRSIRSVSDSFPLQIISVECSSLRYCSSVWYTVVPTCDIIHGLFGKFRFTEKCRSPKPGDLSPPATKSPIREACQCWEAVGPTVDAGISNYHFSFKVQISGLATHSSSCFPWSQRFASVILKKMSIPHPNVNVHGLFIIPLSRNDVSWKKKKLLAQLTIISWVPFPRAVIACQE